MRHYGDQIALKPATGGGFESGRLRGVLISLSLSIEQEQAAGGQGNQNQGHAHVQDDIGFDRLLHCQAARVYSVYIDRVAAVLAAAEGKGDRDIRAAVDRDSPAEIADMVCKIILDGIRPRKPEIKARRK